MARHLIAESSGRILISVPIDRHDPVAQRSHRVKRAQREVSSAELFARKLLNVANS